MRFGIRVLIVASCVALAAMVYFSVRRAFVPPRLKWLVCYDANVSPRDVAGANWAVLDQDADPKALANGRTRFIAYVSVGEAEEYRETWPEASSSGAVLGANPDWPGAHPVDVRHPAWQDILFGVTLAKVAEKGFDGVFLDTLDVPIEMERASPGRAGGSIAAAAGIVKRIFREHPGWIIIPNNALPLLDEIGGEVSAVAVEDLYTHYDFASKTSRPTEKSVTAEKESILDAFKTKLGKPVLNILYAEPDTELARTAIARSRAKGYLWYMAKPDLMRVGTMND